jgi:sarcosine oxidase / L-pipecolate oxidase
MRVLVIGGGIFGATAALELRVRGCDVTLVDPGPLPHPLAESTDISKVVRMDYGNDVDYTALGERALDGWRRWNRDWPAPRFHETGVTFLARTPMQPGGFEHDSYHLLVSRGHALERLDAAAIARRFPAYRPGVYVDGYVGAAGGWAEASAVVMQLVAEAQVRGVTIRQGAIDRITETGAIIAGEALAAELVVVCAGSWVPLLVPALAPSLRAIGQPVFHLAPADPAPFRAEHFPVFGADISRTGYYGFPINRDGLVKIANHGAGVPLSPGALSREVTAAHEAALRTFVRESFPALAEAPIVARRLCVYCDTFDGHFWIARDPERANVVVATGGSGHAFKFAPVLGPLIADLALGEPNPLAAKFRWRPELAGNPVGDAARAT